MSAPAGQMRAVAFATAGGDLWGAAIEPVAGGPGSLVVAARDAGLGVPVRLSEAPDDGWQLQGDGVDLTVTPLAEPLAGAALCQVRGTIASAGGAEVDCAAVRLTLDVPGSGRDVPVSARLLACLFADGTAAGLVAARGGKVAHHDGDIVTAAVFDAEEWISVTEPRLSTTYDADGTPARANLELWIGEGEQEYPRRAAGEASGYPVRVTVDGRTLVAVPQRCHGRSSIEGVGVYLLASLA